MSRVQHEPSPGRRRLRRERRGSTPGISARLLGTILVPLVALSVVLAGSTTERLAEARRADDLSRQVGVLDQLVWLRSALFMERLSAEVLLPSRGVPAEVLARTAFGAELVQDPRAFADRSDAALAAMSPEDRPFDAGALAATRAFSTPPTTSAETLTVRLDDLDEKMAAALDKELGSIPNAAVEVGGPDLVRATTTFQHTVAIPEQAGVLIGQLSDLFVAAPADRVALQADVARSAANFEETSRTAVASIVDPVDPVGRFWDANMALPDSIRTILDDALLGGLSSPGREASQPVEVGLALLDGIDWLVTVNQLPPVAANVVTDRARDVAEDARAAERQTIASAILTVVGSVLAALAFGRSIVSPVRRLTDHAQQVGAGRLDVEPLAVGGPPEIGRAAAAVNDIVANLVLLEQKTHALAECDFDHPALGRPLPGLLGVSLQRSIEVLAESIEQREQLQSRLTHEATHDSLTGLANRAALIETLRTMQNAAGSIGGVTAVVFIDLNDFKRINDRHGHATGDELLRIVGRRMQTCAPARGLLARLGGDEFVLALPDVTSWQEPVSVAHRLVHAAAEPVEIDDRWFTIGASAGVALAEERGPGGPREDPLELIRKADLAVYSAKLDASGDVALYDDELDRRLAFQEDVEDSLLVALSPDSDQLRLMYQPIVDADSAELRGVEALIRWNRPGHGGLAPDAFVPVAERSGLILELDRWVLATALAQMQAWDADPTIRGVAVSVNVSGRSLLDPTFVTHVTDALSSSPVDPTRLSIEVTETALVTDLELAAAQLSEVRALGVRIVIDDFGTGYTSVAHLRALPVDELKIDGSFVQRLPDTENNVFVQMINHPAHNLGISTVAEGVETAEQLHDLRAIGCDALQGFLFSPPVEADELSGWLRRSTDGRTDVPPIPVATLT